MADLFLSPLFTSILECLSSAARLEFRTARGLETELEGLRSTFTTIQSVLLDAEAKPKKSAALQNWLMKLKDVAHDAENILDEIATEALLRRMDAERGTKYQVSGLFLRNPIMFRLRMGKRVKDIRKRLDGIAGERSKFHLSEGFTEVEVDYMEGRLTSSIVNESEIYGRDEEKETIIETLLNNWREEDGLPVYTICGMGGLGKTTLAQLVYNDERVENHFELRIWVCVSDDFDIVRLTRAILESIEGSTCNISELDPLQRRLIEKLRGKRYLLVLDDVWNEYREKWDKLKDVLRYGGKGSRLIVTTRIEKIALFMATFPVHHMDCLSEYDSWRLFKQRAFAIGRVSEDLQLEAIGKAIVKKCGGVPLAIKALGGLMTFKNSIDDWLSVKESEIWDLPNEENDILPALRLSYYNLPPVLRQCFAYCSVFPKDHRMEKVKLIQLWMANGFIPPNKERDLNAIGHEILRNLVWRSFLQDVAEVDDGFICDGACIMHDLMHDLAQSTMRYESFIIESNKVLKFPEKVRHLSFNMRLAQINPPDVVVPSVRSLSSFLLLSNSYAAEKTCSSVVSKQKCLRVLDWSFCAGEKLQISIGKLMHLKYLDLSYSHWLKTLPESISRLQNLQTLRLRQCRELRKLPRGMKFLINLQCLDIRQCDFLVDMPAEMGKLTCLQTLSLFIVGEDRGRQISELKELNLAGELSIKGLENVRTAVNARSANLNRKQNLVSLSLFWDSKRRGEVQDNIEEVLEGLEPPVNLKKLTIESYQGSHFPNWMIDSSLQNLVEVSLRGCARCEQLPPVGRLPFLKFLSISRMDALRSFNNGENSFPALKILSIRNMPVLEEWGDRGEKFPSLRELTICSCPNLTVFPNLPRLKKFTVTSNIAVLCSVMNLTSLSSLTIVGYNDELEVLPEGLLRNLKVLESLELVSLWNLKTLSHELDHLTALKRLKIQGCYGLQSLPEGLKNLKSLENLDIGTCDNFTSFSAAGLQGLSSLQSLQIQGCLKFVCLPEGMQHLTSLTDLLLSGCPEMISFPDDMQHLNSLKSLWLLNCSGLVSLPDWLGNLRSLSSLTLFDCSNLVCLPDGLRNLTTLQTLRISGCPLLERRCKRDKGEDWPKIAHIPQVEIRP